MRLLFDQERLRSQIALLHHVLVRQERREVEGVGPHLAVGVAVFRRQEAPPSGARVGPDFDRPALQIGEAVDPGAGMGDQHRGRFLEDRGDGDEGQMVAGELDRPAAGEVELLPPGQQELHVIELRPALGDGHVKTMPRVDAARLGLVEAAIFGLGLPVEAENHPLPRRRPSARRAAAAGARRRRRGGAYRGASAVSHDRRTASWSP